MLTPSEKTLLKRCRRGDREAQNELYRRELQGVFHLILRLVKDRGTAEDLTQDCFLKVFTQLGAFREDARLRTWIKRIAINLSLDFLRKKERLVFHPEMEALASADSGDTEDPLDMAEIHRAIQDLPTGCRLVFTLHLLEGYHQKEVAEYLGITLSTVKTQYRRAKQLLRIALSAKCR